MCVIFFGDVIKRKWKIMFGNEKKPTSSQVSRVHVNPSNVAQISVGGCCSQRPAWFLIGRILNRFHDITY